MSLVMEVSMVADAVRLRAEMVQCQVDYIYPGNNIIGHNFNPVLISK